MTRPTRFGLRDPFVEEPTIAKCVDGCASAAAAIVGRSTTDASATTSGSSATRCRDPRSSCAPGAVNDSGPTTPTRSFDGGGFCATVFVVVVVACLPPQPATSTHAAIMTARRITLLGKPTGRAVGGPPRRNSHPYDRTT